MKNNLLQILLIIVALAAAGFLWWMLSSTEGPQSTKGREAEGVVVATQSVALYEGDVRVHAGGVVKARRSLQLRPQVSGRIVWLSPSLAAGGLLGQGEVIFRIDPQDYENRLKQAEAALERARVQRDLEEGRSSIAREEWQYFRKRNPDKDVGNRQLALRKPQMRSVQAQIKDRLAAVDQARANLERTRVTAPFDAVVLEQSAAVGMIVSPQTPVAHMVRSDVFDVHVKVAVDKLPFIRLPGKDTKGAAATVFMKSGARNLEYAARVTDYVPAVEPRGRMAQVIVSVREPLRQNSGQPLLLNTFVSVAIDSELDGGYVAIPRDAVHYRSRIYLFDEGKLRVAEPDIVWRLPKVVLVADTIEPGEEVIVSPLAAPVEGMRLRRHGDAQKEKQR